MPDVKPAAVAKREPMIDRIGVPQIIDLTLIYGMLCIIFAWIVFKPDPNNQLLTSLITAWASMTAVIVSFHRGSSASGKSTSDSQTKVVEKLTGTDPPGPISPLPSATPWWSLLTDAEKGAITAAAATDLRVAAFATTSAAGHGTTDDLAYLVQQGLLTQERSDVLVAS